MTLDDLAEIALLKTVVPDGKNSTTRTIIIEGEECRYRREKPTKKNNASCAVTIYKEIGFNGSGHAIDAIKEAIINIRIEKGNKTKIITGASAAKKL